MSEQQAPAGGPQNRFANPIAACLFAGLGTYLLIASQAFEDAGRSTPMFIGAGIIVLSAILVIADVMKRLPVAVDQSADGSQRRRWLFVGLMGVWIALLPYIGFLLAGFLMFALVAAAVPKHERWTPKGLVLHAIAGVVTTVAFWAVLTVFLNVPLPEPTLF